MAKELPLPNHSDLPAVVLFHRQHPSDPRIIMQIPTHGDGFETYVVNLERKPRRGEAYDIRLDHRLWMERLPNGRALLDRLSFDMHVAYYPKAGGFIYTLDDPDAPSWISCVVSHARGVASRSHRAVARNRARAIRRRMSPLRAALGVHRYQRW